MGFNIKLEMDNGGITFDRKLNAATSIIPLTEIPQNWHQYRCIGFDLAHYNDIQNNINTDWNEALDSTIAEVTQKLSL